MLNQIFAFLQRWVDDIAQYGFIGALTGSQAERPLIVPGAPRASGRTRHLRPHLPPTAAHPVNAPTTRSAEPSVARAAAPVARAVNDRLDRSWGPSTGLRQRTEPRL